MSMGLWRPCTVACAAALFSFVLMAGLAGCGGSGSGGGSAASAPGNAAGGAGATTGTASNGQPQDGQGVAPTGDQAALTLAAADIDVPATMRAAPFDQARSLRIPQGFGVRVLARVAAARFLLVTPTGDILVSQPSTGRILLVRPQTDGDPQLYEFATGLSQPHDMVMVNLAGQLWLYIAESSRVTRSIYQPGMTQVGALQTVVSGLPDASTPELRGAYAHALKNIAVSPDGSLFVSIASSCNACESDVNATPVRGAIYRYDADGSNGRLFARGIRNAEGLDFLPGTGQLWMVVNNRDEIPYPLHGDFDADGTDDFGKVLPAYVDGQPPEPFAPVVDAGQYGWPYCNPIDDGSLRDFRFLPDAVLNPGGGKLDCASAVTPIPFGFHAHSAPLGLSFLQASGLPPPLDGGAAVAMHGCWNCTQAFGYRVAMVSFDADGQPVHDNDLVTGFATDSTVASVWGRPVDVAADPQRNSLLVSDDLAGAVYEVYRLP